MEDLPTTGSFYGSLSIVLLPGGSFWGSPYSNTHLCDEKGDESDARWRSKPSRGPLPLPCVILISRALAMQDGERERGEVPIPCGA